MPGGKIAKHPGWLEGHPLFWPHHLMVRIPAFHAGNGGSNPPGVTMKSADPAVTEALVWCAATARQAKGSPAVKDLKVDGYRLTVAVKEIPRDDPRRFVFMRIWSIMFRVDSMAAKLNGLAQGKDLDRWMAGQEHSLDALFIDADGFRAPFSDKDRQWRLSIDMDSAEPDGWGHWFTQGRHRIGMWSVDIPFDWKGGIRGHIL